jgi:DNA-binding MarR family transcriptional regulator
MSDPVDDVTEAVLRASRVLVAVAVRSLAAAPADVTLAQYRVLVVLASRGSQSAGALAEELGVAPSSVTRLCDRLVGKEMVRREPSASSRREVTIAINERGTALVDAVTRARRREISRIVRAIPPSRRSALVRSLEEFGAAAGEVPEQAWSLGWSR